MGVPTHTATDDALQHLLLFDGDCAMCSSLVRFVARRDKHRRIGLEPLRSDAARAQLALHGMVAPPADTLVYLRKGQLLTRSTAALYVARDLTGPWRLAFILIVVPRSLRNAVYRLVAKHRHRFMGPQDSCDWSPGGPAERH